MPDSSLTDPFKVENVQMYTHFQEISITVQKEKKYVNEKSECILTMNNQFLLYTVYSGTFPSD